MNIAIAFLLTENIPSANFMWSLVL